MAPVATRPLITHTLDWLVESGISTASVCANGNTRPLCRCLGDGAKLGLRIEYYEDVMPRGPAGCLRDAAQDSPADLFVVAYGTVLPYIDLDEVIREHVRSDAVLTLVATSSSESSDRAALQPAGIYVFSRSALEHIPAIGYQDIKETLLPALYARGERVHVHLVTNEDILRVTDADSYLRADHSAVRRFCRRAARRREGGPRAEAWVHPSAHLAPSAEIIGPVIIEADCHVGEGAMIIGPASIGEGCLIAAGAVVTRSTLWSGCSIGERATVDRCIVADGGQIAAGAELHDRVWLATGEKRPSFLALLATRFGRRSRKPAWTIELASPAGAAGAAGDRRESPDAGAIAGGEAIVAPHGNRARRKRLAVR